jgi:nucleoside-diphosphate-sugar epimerase
VIIITGSSGFIGSHLVPLIRKKYKGEKLFLVDKPRYNLVTGKGLHKITGKPRFVIHLAGQTDTSQKGHQDNVTGAKNLINSLKHLDNKTHFIFTSSLAVYSGRKDCNKAITTKTTPVSSNEYGTSKLHAEEVLRTAAEIRGFKLTTVRLPTVWGENPRKNSFLNFLRTLVKKNSIFSRIDWPGKTGLINIDDVAKYLLNLFSKPPKKYQIIPIAAENLTLKEIFKTLYKSSGKKYEGITIPNTVWKVARFLKNYLSYFEPILPTQVYNYFWRASIVVDNPLYCKVDVKGIKFTKFIFPQRYPLKRNYSP